MGICLSKGENQNEKKKEKLIFSIVTCLSFLPSQLSSKEREEIVKEFFIKQKIQKTNNGITNWNTSEIIDPPVGAAKLIISFQIKDFDKPDITNYSKKLNDFLAKHSASAQVWSVIAIPKPFIPNKHADTKQYGYLFPVAHFNFDSFSQLFQAISPYFGENKSFSLNMKITNHTKSFFIIYISGTKKLNQSYVLHFLTLFSFVVLSLKNKTLHDLVLYITQNKIDQSIKLLPKEGLFFDFDDHPRFTMRSRRPLLPPEKDVDFFSYKPQIERWKCEFLFPAIEKQLIPAFENYFHNLNSS